jgi:type II secretory pathway pseudopilin PulG
MQGELINARRRGMMLLEIAFAIVILAVAAVAVSRGLGIASQANSYMDTQAVGLEIGKSAMEYAGAKPYNFIAGWLTAPPPFTTLIDAHGDPLADPTVNGIPAAWWKQDFSVTRVQTANLITPSTLATDKILRVTVTVSRKWSANGPYSTVCTLSRLHTPDPQ